ncbi:MAG: amino acid racemase [Candidatus Pacearchaeota archaeon]|nr:amino acid racemase [Candidatus Pacearchaeota archaeon]
MKIVGILGGLGPSTTAKLYLDILNDKKYSKYPNVLISNVSFLKGLDEDIIKNKKSINNMEVPLKESLEQLKKAGANIFVLPCNTLEDLVDRIKKDMKINLLTPIGEVVRKISGMNIKKLGIIATSKTKELKLYENRLKNVEIIYPSKENQKEVSNIISRIIKNNTEDKDKYFLIKIINEFKSLRCDKVVLGCTDLSNLLSESSFVVDSFSVLSKKVKIILSNN